MSKGKLLVLSGPSGVGKGTIVKRLLAARPQASLSVSCTTRAPRDGEKDGESYFFLTKEKFTAMIAEGGFLEYSAHFENFYGTPKKFVEEKLEEGDVILEIEVDGALNVKKVMPEAVLVMIAPPSKEELYARLKGRGTEGENEISRRIDRADYELSKSPLYDYVIINDDLATAVDKVLKILEKEI
ncbi:MAG: guanylate kinase [Clostridia bacterium]|nr:guanylate kinase [Clostridia bacterium]MDE7084437.1 guanylate kinase [Clostridia bacterium]